MSIAARVRPRRALARVCAALALAATLGTAAFLPFAGRFLIRDDPPEAVDAIFVLAGARVDRWLESVELYREQRGARIVLSPGPMRKPERDLRARGIRLPTEADLARDAMLQLGVPADAIAILPVDVDNTAHEAEAFRRYVEQSRWQRVMIVTSPYHTRRTGFAFRREFKGSPVRVLIRASRFDDSDPAHWWRHRADIRMVTSELQKLVMYALGLGA